MKQSWKSKLFFLGSLTWTVTFLWVSEHKLVNNVFFYISCHFKGKKWCRLLYVWTSVVCTRLVLNRLFAKSVIFKRQTLWFCVQGLWTAAWAKYVKLKWTKAPAVSFEYPVFFSPSTPSITFAFSYSRHHSEDCSFLLITANWPCSKTNRVFWNWHRQTLLRDRSHDLKCSI